MPPIVKISPDAQRLLMILYVADALTNEKVGTEMLYHCFCLGDDPSFEMQARFDAGLAEIKNGGMADGPSDAPRPN